MTRANIALAALPLITIAGCGTSVIDADKAAEQISRMVRVQAGVPVKSVDCPTDRKIKAGDNFTCTVIAQDGTKGQVNVRQTNDKGDVRFNAPFIHVDEAEAAIVEQIKRQAGATDVTVNCQDIIVGKTDGPFTCTGTADSRKFAVRATQTDAQGHFEFNAKATD